VLGVKTMEFAMTKLAKTFAAGLLALSLALPAVPAMAQELAPDHLALARRYVDLTDQSNIYEVTIVQAGVDTMRTVIQQKPTIGDQLEQSIGDVIEGYRARKGELMDQFARIYALRFSAEELQQIVAFYESEVGQKLSQNNVLINQELQTVMNVFENNLRTEFFARVRAELREAGVEI